MEYDLNGSLRKTETRKNEIFRQFGWFLNSIWLPNLALSRRHSVDRHKYFKELVNTLCSYCHLWIRHSSESVHQILYVFIAEKCKFFAIFMSLNLDFPFYKLAVSIQNIPFNRKQRRRSFSSAIEDRNHKSISDASAGIVQPESGMQSIQNENTVDHGPKSIHRNQVQQQGSSGWYQTTGSVDQFAYDGRVQNDRSENCSQEYDGRCGGMSWNAGRIWSRIGRCFVRKRRWKRLPYRRRCCTDVVFVAHWNIKNHEIAD